MTSRQTTFTRTVTETRVVTVKDEGARLASQGKALAERLEGHADLLGEDFSVLSRFSLATSLTSIEGSLDKISSDLAAWRKEVTKLFEHMKGRQ